MSARALIRKALEAGVTLRLEGGKVVAAGTRAAVTGILPRLREHRAALARELQESNQEAANDAPGDWNVYVRAGTSSQTVAKFRSASLALDAAQRAAGVSPLRDPDAGCGPNSAAMNGSEIDTFTARRHRFADKGLPRDAAEALADNLVLRDREKDDRRVCFECKSFTGHGPLSWRCANWDVAGVAIRSFDAQLPADLVTQLQRCDGFAKRFT